MRKVCVESRDVEGKTPSNCIKSSMASILNRDQEGLSGRLSYTKSRRKELPSNWG